jgi:death-on-curing protein
VAEYLDLADYLLIAEAVLGVDAEAIARWPGIGLAESALHAPGWLRERRAVPGPHR